MRLFPFLFMLCSVCIAVSLCVKVCIEASLRMFVCTEISLEGGFGGIGGGWGGAGGFGGGLFGVLHLTAYIVFVVSFLLRLRSSFANFAATREMPITPIFNPSVENEILLHPASRSLNEDVGSEVGVAVGVRVGVSVGASVGATVAFSDKLVFELVHVSGIVRSIIVPQMHSCLGDPQPSSHVIGHTSAIKKGYLVHSPSLATASQVS
mmetsp:Transcript_19314/g.33472  ORF Transcript_19314/g.33472 Transcript_19314/m.33472 type:complete len:208 (+) Transcript_19314:112-735(+)